MRDEQLLTELIQNAVANYSYDSGEDEFSAVVTVATHAGWTEKPEIIMYDDKTRQYDPNCNNFHYWLNVASLAISAALNAVARIPADIDIERAEGVNKTLIGLTKAKKIFTKYVANDTRSPDN